MSSQEFVSDSGFLEKKPAHQWHRIQQAMGVQLPRAQMREGIAVMTKRLAANFVDQGCAGETSVCDPDFRD